MPYPDDRQATSGSHPRSRSPADRRIGNPAPIRTRWKSALIDFHAFSLKRLDVVVDAELHSGGFVQRVLAPLASGAFASRQEADNRADPEPELADRVGGDVPVRVV